MRSHRFFIVLCLFLGLGCGSVRPVDPVPPNDFVATFHADRVLDSKKSVPIPDVVEIPINEGFIAQFGIEPAKQSPTEYEGRKVEGASDWSMMVIIYPRNGEANDDSTLRGGVNAINRPGLKRSWMLVNEGVSPFWSAGGHGKQPVPKTPVRKESLGLWKAGGENWYWSFICLEKDQVGEFIFEVHLLPTARWISPVRFEYGPPVVLKRGLLRVKPQQE